MLPSVSPLTSSPKKRLQFTGERFHKTSAAHRVVGRTPFDCDPLGLRDPDEDSLDRVVDTERLLDHVAVPVEGDGKSDCCWLTPSRPTVTPLALSSVCTSSARPVL